MRMSARSSCDAGRELLAVVEAERDLLDPRVVDDVGEGLQRLHALAAERRGDERGRSGSGHRVASSRVGDANVRFGANVPRMPIHYEADGDHVVRITIDRPEARNSCDMEHFKLLREAWERFAGRRPGVGRDRHRCRRGVLLRRGPEEVHARDHQVPEEDRGRRASPRSTATASTTAPARCCGTGRCTSR